MTNKAFQKIYTKITQITKATCTLKATDVSNDEMAIINGRNAQVVKIDGENVTLQVFEGTEGIPTNAEVIFLKKPPTLHVSDELAGRFFNAYGDPIDNGPRVFGEEREIRLRPSYFPFVEPGVEVDVVHELEDGKKTYIEIFGAGMVHPKVLEMGGYEPNKFSGFAFGIGVERISILKHNVEDIRNFYINDLRFLKQFKGDNY